MGYESTKMIEGLFTFFRVPFQIFSSSHRYAPSQELSMAQCRQPKEYEYANQFEIAALKRNRT